MSVRKIITIDEDRCNGCGAVPPQLPRGSPADHRRQGAPHQRPVLRRPGRLHRRTAPRGRSPWSSARPSRTTSARSWRTSSDTAGIPIRAHLEHLRDHGEAALLAEATAYLAENRIPVPAEAEPVPAADCCGQKAKEMESAHAAVGRPAAAAPAAAAKSELTNWPVQMHLLSPMAPSFKGKDVLLAADCVAFSIRASTPRCSRGRAWPSPAPSWTTGRRSTGTRSPRSSTTRRSPP